MDVIGQNGNDGLHYEEEIAEMDSADLPEDLQWVNKKVENEKYVSEGYMQSQPPLTKEDINEEVIEIERIIKRPLSPWEIKDLQESPKTKTFTRGNDDLTITY